MCCMAAWGVGAYQAWMMAQQWFSDARRRYGLSPREAFSALLREDDIFVDVSRRRKANIATGVFFTFWTLGVITWIASKLM
jgi:hypothetical protein